MRTHVVGTNPRTFSCGHECSPSNTKIKPGSRGGAPRARCRICWNEQRRETRMRNHKDPAIVLTDFERMAAIRAYNSVTRHELSRAQMVDHIIAAINEERAVGNQP